MERRFATTRMTPNASAHAYGIHHTCTLCTSGRLAAMTMIAANGSSRRASSPQARARTKSLLDEKTTCQATSISAKVRMMGMALAPKKPPPLATHRRGREAFEHVEGRSYQLLEDGIFESGAGARCRDGSLQLDPALASSVLGAVLELDRLR